MISIFRGQREVLFSERACLSGPGPRVQWKFRTRGGQRVRAKEELALVEMNGQPGIVLSIDSEYAEKFFAYLRGHFVLGAQECVESVAFGLQLALERAPGLKVLVSLFDDPTYTQELLSVSSDALMGDGLEIVDLRVNFRNLPVRHRPVYGFVQICLTTPSGAEVAVGSLTLERHAQNPDYRSLKIRYDAFGDESKASSRLRVWKFVDLLQKEGHTVEVGGKRHDVDLYFCQKVRPFSTVRAVREANPNAVIVYDFDDNFVLPTEGVLSEFLAFIHQVDLVTCGSEYLAQAVRQWHGNVYVLENPLDLDYTAPLRQRSGQLDRIGWFGAPEGLAELKKTNLSEMVETVTRGGTVEFNIRTIDQDLTRYDLLLFPLEQTPWNLAKNANRMMKALGLRIPVLASDTPEHRRLVEWLGLPESCLCSSLEDWAQTLSQVRSGFEAFELVVEAACEQIRANYAPRVILSKLFDHIANTTALGSGVPRRARAAASEMNQVAVAMVDVSEISGVRSSFDQAAVDWTRFHSISVFSTNNHHNDLLKYCGGEHAVRQASFLQVYARAEDFVHQCNAPYLLVVPPGVTLAYGAASVTQRLVQDGVDTIALFTRSAYFSHLLVGSVGAHATRDLLMNIVPLGPMMVNLGWVRQSGVRWDQSFDLWTWAVAVRAFSSRLKAQVIELPCAFEALAVGELNVAEQYAAWLETHQPALAKELPDLSKQWGRLMSDIVSEAAKGAEIDLPWAFAETAANNVMLSRRLAKAERELKILKTKG